MTFEFAASTTGPDRRRFDFWVPTRAYSPIAALNRMGLATGGGRNASAGANADFNGHRIEVVWNDYKSQYVAGYTWAGFHRIDRGSFEDCLRAARRFHARGQLGSSIVVRLRDGDADALEVCLAAPELEPWSSDAVDAHESTWPWQCKARRSRSGSRIAVACEPIRLEKLQGVPTSLFIDAPDEESWRAAVEAWKLARREQAADAAALHHGSALLNPGHILLPMPGGEVVKLQLGRES